LKICAKDKNLCRIETQIKIKGKREKEKKDLYWFILPQEQHPISLPTSKEISLKNTNIQKIQSRTNLALCKITPYIMQNPTTPVQR